jgi:hypothetical protein
MTLKMCGWKAKQRKRRIRVQKLRRRITKRKLMKGRKLGERVIILLLKMRRARSSER